MGERVVQEGGAGIQLHEEENSCSWCEEVHAARRVHSNRQAQFKQHHMAIDLNSDGRRRNFNWR